MVHRLVIAKIIYHGKFCFRDLSLGLDDDAPLVLGTTSMGISTSVILDLDLFFLSIEINTRTQIRTNK